MKELEELFKKMTDSTNKSNSKINNITPSRRRLNKGKRTSTRRYFEELAKTGGIRFKAPKIGIQLKHGGNSILPELKRKTKFRISSSIESNRKKKNRKSVDKRSEEINLRKRMKERINLSFVNPMEISLEESEIKTGKNEPEIKIRKRKKSKSIFEEMNKTHFKTHEMMKGKTARRSMQHRMGGRKESSPGKVLNEFKRKRSEEKKNFIKILKNDEIKDKVSSSESEPEEKRDISKSKLKESSTDSPFRMISRRDMLSKMNTIDLHEAKTQELRNRVESRIQMMKDRRRQEYDKISPLMPKNSSSLVKILIEVKPWIPLGFLAKLTFDQIKRNYPLDKKNNIQLELLNERELVFLLNEISIVEKCGKQLLGKEMKPKDMGQIEQHVKYFNKGRELYLKKIKDMNHYQKLGLGMNCSQIQLKKAFRLLVILFLD